MNLSKISFINVLLTIVCLECVDGAYIRNINDSAYYSMPQLIELDYFRRCDLKGPSHKYCMFEIHLKPFKNETSSVWHVIEEVNRNPTNFRHDIIQRGRCLKRTNMTENQEIKIYRRIFDEEFSKDGLYVATISMKCNYFDRKMDGYDIAALIVFILIFAVNVICTLIDKRMKNLEKPGAKYLQCFSLTRNYNRFRTVKNDPSNNFGFIQGMRFLSMCIIVLGHVCATLDTQAMINLDDVETTFDSPASGLIMNGSVIVQTFFVMSAFLMAIPCFKYLYSGKFNLKIIIFAIIGRYLRLTPSFAVITLFNATLIYYVSKGALWESIIGLDRGYCRRNWLANLFYFSNELKSDEICLVPGWFISADFQLYIIALVLFWCLNFAKRKVQIILYILLIVSMVIPGVLTYVYKLEPINIPYPEGVRRLFDGYPTHQLTYLKSYSNASSYVVGILMGYWYHTGDIKKRIQSKVIRRLAEVCTYIVGFGVLLVSYFFYTPEYGFNRITSSVYAATYKFLFACTMSLLMWGIISDQTRRYRILLEWKPFVLLGRLSFSVYLVHWPILRVFNGKVALTNYYDVFDVFVIQFSSMLMLSHLLGLVLALCVEFPMSALTKILIEYGSRKKEDKGIRPQIGENNNYEPKINTGFISDVQSTEAKGAMLC